MSQDSQVGSAQEAVAKPSTDGFAIAALICAILGIVPLGLLFGIIALVRIHKRRRSGRGLAISSLVISGLWVVGVALAVVFAMHKASPQAAPTTTASSTTQPANNDISVFALGANECINSRTGTNHVQHARCDQPHNEQIFAKPELDWRRTPYPGASVLQSKFTAECEHRAKVLYAPDPIPAEVKVRVYVPSETEWNSGPQVAACSFTNP